MFQNYVTRKTIHLVSLKTSEINIMPRFSFFFIKVRFVFHYQIYKDQLFMSNDIHLVEILFLPRKGALKSVKVNGVTFVKCGSS